MAPLTPFHPALRNLLSEMPSMGTGHRWMMKAAAHLRHYYKPDAVEGFLRAICDTWHHRRVPDAEIRKTVHRAFADRGDYEPSTESWAWPEPDAHSLELALQHPPLRIAPVAVDASRCIRALYTENDLVCAGMAADNGATLPRDELLALGPERFALIVPSPMSRATGRTKDGKESYRCLDNCGPRRWLVTEYDRNTEEEQLRLITCLSSAWGLEPALVVHSGGKSLHAWWYVSDASEQKVRWMFLLAAGLGADVATWTRCQWVRMPGGTRATGERQPVLFWNDDFLGGL